MPDKIIRRLRGGAAAVAVTVLLSPVHGIAVLVFLLSAQRYDSSGQGGPFRSCAPDSVSCAGPNVPLMIGSALVVAGGLLLACWAGRRAARP
ncbi:hypothetical protein [Amycolatopsis methanolica]|uniref:Uncharacterized protein n=1 Tax=Amycolatopsis methanolica 239 TaxID=1068978 RepID=A0A076N185_AMYME|nr:hypothetical protein [Amycolatopsis methanolica]AIJ23637.1 hypothetical protein AMETH_3545 [Amycolatopsis methanolica 239]